ncbi:MAG: sulfatase-like hydrolase/transferase [Planctomycetaceae bacterium]
MTRSEFCARLLHRITTLALWAITGLIPLFCDSNAYSKQKREQPNIIFILADDQGWGDVAYNGNPVVQTPVLDDMAATGLRFDRFYAAHPVCSPTRGSVMTGRHPNRFACFSWGHALRPEEITVAEALHTAGYATGHFGKWHLGTCREDDDVSPGHSGFDTWVSSPNFYDNSPLLAQNGKVISTEGEGSEVTIRHAIDFIRAQAAAKTPSLTVIWLGSPHSPHEALPELRALYPHEKAKLQNYYGEITGIDRAVGLLREELRKLGIAENTLLWYTSDNGANLPGSTGGLRGKKGNLWEGGVRVPCIIEWPRRITAPRTTNVPAVTSDIYPTLLALTGVSMPGQPPLDGISLLPLIDGQADTRSNPIGFWVHPTGGIRTPSAEWLADQQAEQSGQKPAQPAPQRTEASRMVQKFPTDDLPGHSAWLDGDWKLHHIPVKKSNRFDDELYNLQTDPEEAHNVALEHPDRVAKMKQQLREWQLSVVRSLNGEDYAKP